jgi:Fur family ferric uptake transcriptional regulator
MKIQQIFTNAGLRSTKARIAVLSTISDASSALSHSEILDRLSNQKEFDRVTIYRVLDWLTEHHLIHKISGENRAWKFQISKQQFSESVKPFTQFIAKEHHHAHLHCKVCGKVTCVHELEPHFPANILAQYQVSSIDINIKGICTNCATATEQ